MKRREFLKTAAGGAALLPLLASAAVGFAQPAGNNKPANKPASAAPAGKTAPAGNAQPQTDQQEQQVFGQLAKAWTDSGLVPLEMPHQTVIMDDFNHAADAAGKYELIQNPGGQIAGMLSGLRSSAEITRDLAEGAAAVIRNLQKLVG